MCDYVSYAVYHLGTWSPLVSWEGPTRVTIYDRSVHRDEWAIWLVGLEMAGFRGHFQQVESLRSILDYPMRYLKGKAERSALLFLSLVSLLVTEWVSLIPGCEWDRTPVAFSFPNLAGIKADFFIPMWFLVLHWFKLEGGREIGALLNLKNICLGQSYMQQYLIVFFPEKLIFLNVINVFVPWN